MVRHFCKDLDIDAAEQAALLASAMRLRAAPGDYARALAGQVLGMIFAKSSTRTRVSFEVGALQLGGHAIFLPTHDNQLGRGEPLSDTAQVLSRYVDALLIRTFAHADVLELAAHSSVPVINGLDDTYHPCQVLADLLTVQMCCGTLAGTKLTYVGDGNNMAHSLMCGGALGGMHVRICAPKDYAPQAQVVQQAQQVAAQQGGSITVDPALDLLDGADVVYTDVWASMGQEAEQQARLRAFAGYQVTAQSMQRAASGAIFLHCLPAHRGEEVAAEVIDGVASRVLLQAENRLHAQKALLAFLLRGSVL